MTLTHFRPFAVLLAAAVALSLWTPTLATPSAAQAPAASAPSLVA